MLFPNPANESTLLSYNLLQSSDVQISLLNVLGQKVMEIESGFQIKGSYNSNVDCSKLSKGIYFVSMAIDGKLVNRKLIKFCL
jgi:hypothetical protein